MLPSGHVYPATVVGSDAAQGLALVQLTGGSTFKPAATGNSGDFAAGAAAISVSTSPAGKEPDKAPHASELTPCNKHARFTRAPWTPRGRATLGIGN